MVNGEGSNGNRDLPNKKAHRANENAHGPNKNGLIANKNDHKANKNVTVSNEKAPGFSDLGETSV